jgi:hypothetical protein
LEALAFKAQRVLQDLLAQRVHKAIKVQSVQLVRLDLQVPPDLKEISALPAHKVSKACKVHKAHKAIKVKSDQPVRLASLATPVHKAHKVIKAFLATLVQQVPLVLMDPMAHLSRF